MFTGIIEDVGRVEAVTVNVLRDCDIAKSIEGRQEVEPLKNETYLMAPQTSPLGIAHGSQVVAIHQYAPAAGAC